MPWRRRLASVYVDMLLGHQSYRNIFGLMSATSLTTSQTHLDLLVEVHTRRQTQTHAYRQTDRQTHIHKTIPPVVTRVTIAWSVHLYVCYLSHSCTLLKPLVRLRCHLARTLVWSQVTLCYIYRAVLLLRQRETCRTLRTLRTVSSQRCCLLLNYFDTCYRLIDSQMPPVKRHISMYY